MHKFLVPIFGVIAFSGFSQTPNNCGNYTSTGTIASIYLSGPNAACNANVPGVVSGSGAWTGGTCAGNIVSTVVGPPVTCLTVSYTSVNTNDFATLTTDTGGSLTITGVNVGVSGNVIGPYMCGSGSGTSGDVLVNICSTIPFSVLTLTNTGCASGWIINCATATLPVELVSFEAAIADDNQVRLEWTTATELDNDYFVVERSRDAENFTAVQTVRGAGNSADVLEYAHNDLDPYSGISYYRLKQVDFNGEYSYSPIRTVAFDNQEGIKLYPNPAEHQLEVELSGINGREVSVQVADVLGRIMLNSTYVISDDASVIPLDVSNLESGVYRLQVRTDEGAYFTKDFTRK